jgi:hypothetical protein
LRCHITTASAEHLLIDPSTTADLVQDLYLRELKAYKPPTVKASDSEGQVQKFALPQAPASPEEADIASQLSAYETQEVEVEGQAEAGAAPIEDWYRSHNSDAPLRTTTTDYCSTGSMRASLPTRSLPTTKLLL